jgi:hypothetical protein
MKRMWMMRFLILSASVSLLCFPLRSFSGDYYAYIQPGAYIPQHKHVFLIDDKFDTGPNIEVVFGKYVNSNIAGELGIGYFQTKGELYSPRTQLKEQVWDIFYTLKGLLPMGPVELYGGGGFGLYVTKSSIYSDYEVNSNLGLHVLAGGRYNINEKLFVGLEGKYLWSSASFSNGSVIDDAQLDGVYVSGNVGVRF